MGKSLLIKLVENDFTAEQLIDNGWLMREVLLVNNYWSGAAAPFERSFRAECTWSATALNIRFETSINEPLVISSSANLASKTIGLWERDVCEIFIAPDRLEPRRYFEFEIAPTGEWLDLAIDFTKDERITDWNYNSGMETAALIESAKITMAMKIPWDAFGKKPKTGDVWLGNTFRCVGKEPVRGYLAWRPTMTVMPNFHVPEAFGEFRFV